MLDYRTGQSRPKFLERSNLRKLSWALFAVGMVVVGGRTLWRMSTERIATSTSPTHDETILAQRHEAQVIPGSFRISGPADAAPQTARPRDLFPGVNEELMADLRDDQLFKQAEGPAFYHLLGLLRNVEEAKLQERSLGVISYAQLFRQPQVYRGKAVEVRGTVRRVKRFDASPNQADIDHYYQLAVAPSDEPTSPVFVYCLELPDQFPTPQAADEELSVREEISLAGIFYRRWGYPSRDERGVEVLRSAPLVMSRTVRWLPPPPLPTPPGFGVLIKLLAGTIVAAIVLMLLARRFVAGADSPTPSRHGEPAAPQFSGIDTAPPPADALRSLEISSRESTPPLSDQRAMPDQPGPPERGA